jgi:phosphoribosyl-ATP pyrophosphohydrolase/phosphoribosyl-AMP cyclohydrolase
MNQDDAVEAIIETIKFDKNADGLVPAVVQDSENNAVLMLGFMNREALRKTLTEGKVTFWQRSRQKLWTKGDTSGNVLVFQSLRVNCNEDSLLVLARPVGATCHTGHPTCYYRQFNPENGGWDTISEQQFNPDDVYGKN